MITNFKIFESSGFGKSYPGHEEPVPKFKIGDKVMVVHDLKQYGKPYYNTVKGDLVNITDFHINMNGDIAYNIDNPKLKKLRKNMYTRGDTFSEFHFEYEWKINAKKYNI